MSLFESIKQAKCNQVPWVYHTLSGALSDKQIQEIKMASFDKSGHIHNGKRSGNDDSNHHYREYITKENADSYPQLTQLIRDLQSLPIRRAIAELTGQEDCFRDSYVRLEILHDKKGFWLEKHQDIPEKLISSLIYINDTNEDTNLGTDLYDEAGNLICTVPFHHNFGYIFAGPKKLHGMEKDKVIKVERRGIQLNYVTFKTDWPVDP